MKIFAIAVAAALLSTSAFAQSSNSSGSASQSSSTVNVGGNPAYVNSDVRGVPGVAAPGLAASAVGTCLGSASIGGSGLGWGGVLGITVKDKDCNLRAFATLVAQLGNTSAAYEILCNNREVREALATVGQPCARDRRAAPTTVASVTPSVGSRTVRRRVNIANLERGVEFALPNDPTVWYVSNGDGTYRPR